MFLYQLLILIEKAIHNTILWLCTKVSYWKFSFVRQKSGCSVTGSLFTIVYESLVNNYYRINFWNQAFIFEFKYQYIQCSWNLYVTTSDDYAIRESWTQCQALWQASGGGQLNESLQCCAIRKCKNTKAFFTFNYCFQNHPSKTRKDYFNQNCINWVCLSLASLPWHQCCDLRSSFAFRRIKPKPQRHNDRRPHMSSQPIIC